MGQSLSHLLVHAIFSTKDRRPFLRSEEIRDEIYAYMAGTLKNLNGNGAFSVSESNVELVTAYILNQAEHHKKLATRKRFAKFSNATGSPSRNAMFGIETPKGRTPLQLQGASLDVTSPRAKAPGLFCLTAPRS